MNDDNICPDRLPPPPSPSADVFGRMLFGGLSGLTAGALVGAAGCWFVGRTDLVWLGGVFGAVFGSLGGVPLALWASRSSGDLQRQDVASTIGMTYGLLFIPLILLGAGGVSGRLSAALLLGMGMAGPMLGLLVGALLDRVYEGSRKNLWAVALVAGLLGVTTFVGIPAVYARLDPPPDPDVLAAKARKLILHEYEKNPKTRNATVRAIQLTHEEGNRYVGFAEVMVNGEGERLRLEVVVTDDGFTLTTEPIE
jgi:hypothetical protein